MGASSSKQSHELRLQDRGLPVDTVVCGGPKQDPPFQPLDDKYIPIVTDDITSSYSGLTQHYQAGNTILVSYNLVPTTSLTPFTFLYRAILRLVPSDGSRAQGGLIEYDLIVETSTIMLNAMTFENISSTEGTTSGTEGTTSGTEGTTSGTVTQDIDILKKIAQKSSQGGRLMCLAVTLKAFKNVDLFKPKTRFSLDWYIDLFFEVPRTPHPPLFTYQAVNAIIPYRVKGFRNKKVTVEFDYLTFFTTQLNQGWKLVAIVQHNAGKNKTNCVWFFEKEMARLNDPTPVYEGTIVTHQHVIEGATNGPKAITSDVTPILQEMGEKGWELACLLETPEVKRRNSETTQMTILLFFQWRIIGEETSEAPSNTRAMEHVVQSQDSLHPRPGPK